MVIGNSFLIQHFMNSVWLIHPEKLKTMTEVLVKKATEDMDGSLNLLKLEPKEQKPAYVQRVGRIAVLNIEGVLVPKASWLDTLCGFVSTIELQNQFETLVADPTIERIVIYLDSPGGISIAIPEFANAIYEARSEKEIVAFTDYYMCSAAYWLGAAAEQLVVTPSSIIGSIGTYISLIKEKPETNEYDIHIIQAGENKLFGSPDTPLTDDEITYFQQKVDQHYETFTETMAQYRNISQEEIKNTKASYYTSGEDAPNWMYDTLADVHHVLS